MPISIQKAGPPAPLTLDGVINEVGDLVTTDECADAQASQARAGDQRRSANLERAKVAELKEKQRRDLEEAQKPSIFGKIMGVVGRAFAAIATAGTSLVAEAIAVASTKGEGGLLERMFSGKQNLVFGILGGAMAPLVGITALVGFVKQKSDDGKQLNGDASDIEHSAVQVDKLRKEMTQSLELAKAANDRAASARDDFNAMSELLNRVTKSIVR